MARNVVTTLARIACLAALGGCGAKTGLLTPDVPEDRATPPLEQLVCIDVQPDAGVLTVNLETRPQLSVADVLFLIDHSGSTDPSIDNVKANLQRTIVPGIAASIDDVEFGVADFKDFPVYWSDRDTYGDPGDLPFTLVSPIDPSLANVQGALNTITSGGGGDEPEDQVEALYQTATGEGYLPWITPRGPCSAPGRFGYPCFRPNAQPIIILITDSTFHNGPVGLNGPGSPPNAPYADSAFTMPIRCPSSLPNCPAARGPHTYAEAIDALNRIHARVIGVGTGEGDVSSERYLIRTAIDTGTVTASGVPLEFPVGRDASQLDTRIVSAVRTLSQQVPFNASARVLDLDPARSVRNIVLGVRPLSASPAGQVQRIDATTFYGVVPGTQLTFAIDLATSLPRMAMAQRFPARVQFYADGRPNLGHRDIVIVIPGLNGDGCDTDGGTTTVEPDGGGIDAGM